MRPDFSAASAAPASSRFGLGQRAREDRALTGQEQDLAGHRGVGDPSRQGHGLVGVVPHPLDVAGHHEQAEPPGQRPAARDVGRSGPDPVEPRQPLAGVATQREVEPDVARDLGGIPVAVELEQPQVGRAQVGVVGLEPVERDGEARPLEGIAEGRRAGVEVRGVPVGGRGGRARLVQALHRELPHRLEQPEPRLVVGSRHPQHERLVDERAEGGQDVGAVTVLRDRPDVVEREPAAEHREPGEEVDLLRLEEVHAPVEHGGHRAVPVGQVARAGAEAGRTGAEPGLLQPGEQGRWGEQPQARRRELEREGDAVEPAADRRQRGRVVLGDGGR